jgi:hypothetical protein
MILTEIPPAFPWGPAERLGGTCCSVLGVVVVLVLAALVYYYIRRSRA